MFKIALVSFSSKFTRVTIRRTESPRYEFEAFAKQLSSDQNKTSQRKQINRLFESPSRQECEAYVTKAWSRRSHRRIVIGSTRISAMRAR